MTPSPPVVIEMPASDAGAPFAQTLVEACTDGLGASGPCALEGAATEASTAHAVAIVSWDGGGRGAATVEVGVRRGAQADWRTRRVAFAASDAEIERWRSLGLIIATLVGGETPHDAAPPAAPPPAPERPAPPQLASAEKAPPKAASSTWSFEAGAVGARGAADALGAWGPSVRASVALHETPFFVTASFRYETESASAQVRIDWGWAALGVGLATSPAGPVLVEGRVEPTLGFVRASASDAVTQSGLLFGVREGAALTWWWARWIGPSLSADVVETTRSTSVEVTTGAGSTQAARAQWIGWSAGVGIRVRLGVGGD